MPLRAPPERRSHSHQPYFRYPSPLDAAALPHLITPYSQPPSQPPSQPTSQPQRHQSSDPSLTLPRSLPSLPTHLNAPSTRRTRTEYLSYPPYTAHPSYHSIRNLPTHRTIVHPPTYPATATTTATNTTTYIPHGVAPGQKLPPHRQSGISWHRRSTHTSTTTSGATSPVAPHHMTTPISPTRLVPHAVYKPRAATTLENAYIRFSVEDESSAVMQEKKKATNRRRRTSLLTAAFGRRRASQMNHAAPQFSPIPIPSQLHPMIPMAAFPCHWSSDTIVLYTNSMRTELNDLLFLTSCLQRVTPHTPPSAHRRSSNLNIHTDFYRWFSWFAKFTNNIFRAFEQHLFPLITQLLDQRDTMISRCTASVEAQGESHIKRWKTMNISLFRQIEQVRVYISTVESRLQRLHRKTVPVEYHSRVELCNSNFVTISHLITSMAHLLQTLDQHIPPILSLRFASSHTLQSLYCQLGMTIVRDPDAPLGYAAVQAMTRWMEDRKIRHYHVGLLSRATRLKFLARYRTNIVHLNIVKAHRSLYTEKYLAGM